MSELVTSLLDAKEPKTVREEQPSGCPIPRRYEGGLPVDPQAEAALARWALSKPRQDCEELPVAPVALVAPNCDPDPYDLKREQEERRAREEERGERLWE